MAARRADIFLLLLTFLVLFFVFLSKGSQLIRPDKVSITVHKEYLFYKESFMLSACKLKSDERTSRKSLFLLLILVCGDVDSCPGPLDTRNITDFCNQSGLKILRQNIRGLLTNLNGLSVILQSNNIDVMTLSETHVIDLAYNDKDDLYKIPGYTYIKSNRKNGKGGGVAMYIKECLNWEHRKDLESEKLETLWIEVFVKKSKSFL